MACFFYIVLTLISTISGLWSTGNTRKYHQIDVYIYQCEDELIQNSGHSSSNRLFVSPSTFSNAIFSFTTDRFKTYLIFSLNGMEWRKFVR